MNEGVESSTHLRGWDGRGREGWEAEDTTREGGGVEEEKEGRVTVIEGRESECTCRGA